MSWFLRFPLKSEVFNGYKETKNVPTDFRIFSYDNKTKTETFLIVTRIVCLLYF